MLRRLLLGASLVGLLPLGVGAAEERWQILVRDWLAAVDAHVPGEADEAAQSIAAWTRSDLESLLPYLSALTNIEADIEIDFERRAKGVIAPGAAFLRGLATGARRHGERHRIALRGAFLHTDVVTLVSRDPQIVAPPRPRRRQSLLEREETTPRVLARVPDGRLDTFELSPLHWDLARRLLAPIDPSSAESAVARLWYRTVAAYFAHERNLGEGRPHLDHAVRLFPTDAGVLLASGCLHETMASPGIQEFVRTTMLPNDLRVLDVEPARTHLLRAEAQLRRSVEREPTFIESRVRLGRTLGQLDRHSEAATELRRAAIEAREPALRFYAELFAGDEELALGRLDDAESAYQRALGQFPGAQSARLALSYLARHRGDRAAALTLLEPSLGPLAPDRDEHDPWRDYFLGEGRRVRDLFVELYGPFLPPRER